MKSMHVMFAAVFMACTVAYVMSYPLEELEDEFDSPQYRPTELDPDLRRLLLLKKLRFREILDKMHSPDEILEPEQEDMATNENHHKASKRRKMDDLMEAFIRNFNERQRDFKVRQIKESMELPSLRFGRSGHHFKH